MDLHFFVGYIVGVVIEAILLIMFRLIRELKEGDTLAK